MGRLTDFEVSDFMRVLQRMMSDQYQKYIDWDHSSTEQGTWLTKTFVSMWFRNETFLPTMVGMLDIVKKEFKKCPMSCMDRRSHLDWRWVRRRSPWKRSMHCSTKVLKQWTETNPQSVLSTEKNSDKLLCGRCHGCKIFPEGDDLPGEGWSIKLEVIVAICAEFSESLFEVVVNSSWRKSRIFRFNPDRQVDMVFFPT